MWLTAVAGEYATPSNLAAGAAATWAECTTGAEWTNGAEWTTENGRK
jgi:hypothetical protein